MKRFLLAVTLLAAGSFASSALAGEWSDYAPCDNQYTQDSAVCRQSKSKNCWSSASDRLAKCNATKGKTLGVPTLLK